MEGLKLQRTPLRSAFTKTANALEETVNSSSPNVDILAGQIAQLEEKGNSLAVLDHEMRRLMQEGGCAQEDYNREFEAAEAYRDRFVLLMTKGRRLMQRLEYSGGHGNSSQANNGDSTASRRKFRLPEIELKKFGGDLKDWLSFWGQFKKIHDDDEIDPADKFQYLLQATEPNSRPRQLVESFPPSADSYAKAVDGLTGRFGREDTLVEVYVRELLRLVLQNALSQKQKPVLTVLYDKLETYLRALESLGVTTDKYAAMLYPLVESCLPEDILRVWERSRGFGNETGGSDVQNRLGQLMLFLKSEVEGEERISLARTGFGLEFQNKKGGSKTTAQPVGEVPTAAGLFSGSNSAGDKRDKCIFCDKPHPSTDCRQAPGMPLDEKRALVVQHRCCFVCLKPGHVSKKCKSKQRCVLCSKRHPVVMCPGLPAEKDDRVSAQRNANAGDTDKDMVLASHVCTSDVLLQTLTVRIRGKNKEKLVRVLIDTGSQRSYISERAASMMEYPSKGQEQLVQCLFGGSESSRRNHHRYQVHLASLDGGYKCNFEVLDQPRICGAIPKVPNGRWVTELNRTGIRLSDLCTDNRPADDIEVLIGADIAGKLLTGKVIQLDQGPVAVETRLGWTVMGKTPNIVRQRPTADSTLMVATLLVENARLSDLWNLDVLGIRDPTETTSAAELQKAAMDYFLGTVTVNSENRYEVALPWIEGHPPLPNNKELAEKRLRNTLKRVNSDGIFQAYGDILVEWQSEGIIEKVPVEHLENPAHYLPHRPVVRDDHETTKIRPVFDASAHERNSPALNDCVEKGPNLTELLPSILTRFRLGRFGVTSDIEKAFLQISLRPQDRDFLRFLWAEKGDGEQVETYRHRRVVFGVSCSPFLLNATLEYHLDRAPEHLSALAGKLKDSFYVDNCVTSLDNMDELFSFVKSAQELMAMGHFNLRGWKWNSNSCVDEVIPVLGLTWNLRSDTLGCDLRTVTNYDDAAPVTKRKILSVTHKVFDPLGFSCPVTLCAKLLIQEAWELHVTWDEELPGTIADRFREWCKQLTYLSSLHIPRWLGTTAKSGEVWTVHVFCDASRHAYATCVFLRVESPQQVSVQLLQARSRVAPVKRPPTIPRMELLACSIGTRLASKMKQDLRLCDVRTFFWSDSTTAISWIKGNDQWRTFVFNRVKEIRSLCDPLDWRHIPGSKNPADLPSRGCEAKALLESRWWEGPDWLLLDQSCWPVSTTEPDEAEVNTERKKIIISAASVATDKDWYYRKFSSYLRIVRMLAWILRFYENLRSDDDQRKVGELSVEEVDTAENQLFRLIQKECFQGLSDPCFRTLGPVVEMDRILRLRTSLVLRRDEDGFKYPIVLPSNHPVVDMLIYWKHVESSHAGTQVLVTLLREKVWILKARKTVRRVVQKCGRCRRYRVEHVETPPAPLPEDRVKEAAVFEVIGVDLAGPLFLREKQKAWIVVFTCAVYRAIHLELVTSLSTEAFLQSFRRFVARRGRPSTVYSDNGTNFVGAHSDFSKVNWDTVFADAATKRITWKFNPPTASWWGGFWERLIGLIKGVLRRVLGRATLSYEELLTVLCDCEATVNSRPLTYLSEDPDDLTPLTPMLFLQELRTSAVPDVDQLDGEALNQRARYRQQVRDSLRKRFRVEYLGELRQRVNRKQCTPISEGDIVLVGNDHDKRVFWPLAKVVKLFPGKDGQIRVVSVKTAGGELLRPVQRLYPLEVNTNDMRETFIRKNSDTSDINVPVRTRSGRIVKPPQRLQC